jgi:hypothetical protein
VNGNRDEMEKNRGSWEEGEVLAGKEDGANDHL